MGKDEPIVTVEKLRDELIKTAVKVRSGELTPTKGNSIANILRTALYAEQIRYQQEKGLEVRMEQAGVMELSDESKAKLDEIARLMAGKPSKRGKE